MDIFQAVILGVIQGLTEFLPVSSSGHLVIFQRVFGLSEPELFFDISVHIGTLAAVFIYFRMEIRDIVISFFRFVTMLAKNKVSLSRYSEKREVKTAFLIIAGSIPTAIIGIIFHTIADTLFSSVSLVGFMLIITGLILWRTRSIQKIDQDNIDFSFKEALIIGLIQGLAVIPGISRSGSTIAVGLFLGLNRETAASFSFLLSIPAIIGAAILTLKDVSELSLLQIGPILSGVLTSFVVGYIALMLLMHFVKKGRLFIFAPYCWFVGVTALIMALFF